MARKTRVALFFTTLHRGGTESQALLLARAADRKRFALHAYALQGGPLEKELRGLGIPVRVLQLPPWSMFRAAATVRRWMHEDRIEVLHCLLWHPNILGRLACRGTGVRCINSVRWAERRFSRDWLDYLTRPLVDHWIANSSHGAQLARLPRGKTTIIHNGLPEKLLRSPLAAWKPRPKTAIMIGQFRREKQHHALIGAALLLPDWHFTLVGDGPLLAEAKRHARDVRAKNVEFLGHRADVHSLLLQHEVSVLLSKSEGSPNATLESLALGVPFIGSEIAAHRELLADGRGTLVKAKPAAVAAAIRAVHNTDRVAKNKARVAARDYIRRNYSTSGMVKATESVWLSRQRF